MGPGVSFKRKLFKSSQGSTSSKLMSPGGGREAKKELGVLLVLYIEQRAQHPRASTFFDVMIVGLHSRIKVIIVRSVRILVFSRIDVKIRQSCMVLRETAEILGGHP